jgi:hypothetical protein
VGVEVKVLFYFLKISISVLVIRVYFVIVTWGSKY